MLNAVNTETVAVYLMCYNFVRIQRSLRVSPAMQAGVTGRLAG